MNKFTDAIIFNQPLEIGKDWPEVPLPDSITICRKCGEVVDNFDLCDRCDGKLQMQEDNYRDDT